MQKIPAKFESYSQKQKYYESGIKDEPNYTKIPAFYWRYNSKIKDMAYVKERMHTKTITAKLLEEACYKYPEIFCYYMLGIHLRPYQHYALDVINEKQYTAMAWGRRLGKSTIAKLFVLWTSYFNKLPGDMTGTTWNIILQDQEIANTLYIEPLHEIMEKGDKRVCAVFKGALGEHYFTEKLVTRRDKSGKVRSNQISFKTKTGICRINTMPPSSKAIGREGNLLGDEVTKWRNNPKLRDEFKYYDQLIAIMKDKPIYKAIFLTTPEGNQDLYAKEIFDPNNELPEPMYVKIWFSYWARVEEVWLQEMEKTKREAIRKGRLPLYQQEYEAKFMTISDPFFPIGAINKHKVDVWAKNYETHTPCSVGIDWGGTQKSETAIVIRSWDLKKDSPRDPIYIKHYPIGEDLKLFWSDMARIKNNFNVKWVTPDSKGGRWAIPELERMFGPGRVKPLNFSTDKKAGYELYRQGILQGIIPIPNYVPLIKQIENFSNELKPNSSNGKDDILDADMMACKPLLEQKNAAFRVIKY